MTAMEMSTEPSMFCWKETQTRIPGRWSGRRKESQDRRTVARRNLMRKEKKIETETETIVGDAVGHQDGGEVPAVDESFVVRKMDWMAQKVEGLLEEAQKEAEEAVAEAEVALVGGEEDFLLKEWEPLTQLIMQSQPILMITMAITVATRGTTLVTLNQMMGRDLISLGLRGQIIPENFRLLLVHGELQQKSGELKIGMKIFLKPRSSLLLMCLQCLCLRRM
jgi:hypothetical protein